MKNIFPQHWFFNVCKNIADNETFQSIILFIILLNALFLWIETSNELMSVYGNTITQVLVLSQIIFVWEIWVRLLAYGPNNYKSFFWNFWNKFDFTIVLLSFLPEIGWIVTIIRILRVLRILRILSISDTLRNYLESLKTTPIWIIIGTSIYLVLTYTIALISYYLFSDIDPIHWWTLALAFRSIVFMSLFQDIWIIFQKILEQNQFAILFIIGFYIFELLLLTKIIITNKISSK